MATVDARLLRGARAAARLPGIRRLARARVVGRLVWVTALSRLVEESARFLVRELGGSREVAVYAVREPAVTVALRHGSADLYAFEEIFHRRAYALPRAVEQALDSVGPKLRIVDLGANVGLFTAWIGARYPGATIVAYEADSTNADVAERMAAANDRTESWTVVRAAAGAVDGSVQFLAGAFTLSRIVDEAEPGGTTVRKVDVLPVLAEADLAKIDIEGGEWELLEDPRFASLELTALVFEYHSHLAPPGSNPQATALERLRRAGYRYEVVGETTSDYGTYGMIWAWRPEKGRDP